MVLHEIIAIEEGTKQKAVKIIAEAQNTFNKKETHFDGQSRNYSPATEEDEKRPGEDKPVVETVNKKLNYVFKAVVDLLDLAASKELTNTKAKADLMIDGTLIAKDVPVTTLVQLENRLSGMRNMLDSIPTLDPVQVWMKSEESGLFETEQKTVQSLKQIFYPVILSPATEKHPAQVSKETKNVVCGTWKTTLKSGRISSAEKSGILSRLDTVIREVKQARQRANMQTVEHQKFATPLLEFILGSPLT